VSRIPNALHKNGPGIWKHVFLIQIGGHGTLGDAGNILAFSRIALILQKLLSFLFGFGGYAIARAAGSVANQKDVGIGRLNGFAQSAVRIFVQNRTHQGLIGQTIPGRAKAKCVQIVF